MSNKRNRRSLKKNKVHKFNVNGKSIRIVGVNAAGITSKLDSFDKLIFDRRPSIWMMQETKQRVTDKQIQTKNLVNYQVFEMKRGKTVLIPPEYTVNGF